MVGPFPTYVGKIQGKRRKGRPPIKRWSEHGGWSKRYMQHFIGRRRRNLRSKNRFGRKACLPRTLAAAGPHNSSIVNLQRCTFRETDFFENRWEQVLCPTSNGVSPYSGPQHIDWVLGGTMDRGDSGSLSQLAHEIIDAKDPPFTAPNYLLY